MVSMLDCQPKGSGLISPPGQRFFEISAPVVHPNQLSYDEYTDHTLSVGR